MGRCLYELKCKDSMQKVVASLVAHCWVLEFILGGGFAYSVMFVLLSLCFPFIGLCVIS